MNVKIFADGADINEMVRYASSEAISGLTTNPTLMKKAGVSDYFKFAQDVVAEITTKPISFEVFSDDFDQMYEQALKLSDLADNVYVKVPITNTTGQSSATTLTRLAAKKVKLNSTAIFTSEQVDEVLSALPKDTHAYISIFAGRIADTGIDPTKLIAETLREISKLPNTEVIWASPREVYNIAQADKIGCDIITVSSDLLSKMHLLGKDLDEYSLETVKMFRDDALAAGFSL